MVYNEFNFVRLPALKGYIHVPEKALLNDSTWFSGTYQIGQEDYMNAFFGLRSLYVRLHNQLKFSVFKLPTANGVIIGKENYFYEENYIKAYTGNDFLGDDSITQIVNRIKFISDTLTKLNKQLIIV